MEREERSELECYRYIKKLRFNSWELEKSESCTLKNVLSNEFLKFSPLSEISAFLIHSYLYLNLSSYFFITRLG